ncbi:MAG: hypothetical protein ACLT98_09410 [Eggerthellaceae bacterium]
MGRHEVAEPFGVVVLKTPIMRYFTLRRGAPCKTAISCVRMTAYPAPRAAQVVEEVLGHGRCGRRCELIVARHKLETRFPHPRRRDATEQDAASALSIPLSR